MSIAGVVERLEASVESLAESEAKVARFILQRPRDVLDLTVRDLARVSKSSQAAVTRLCHSLQVDGYQALKVLLTADVVRQEGTPGEKYAELQPDAPFSSVLEAFSQGAQSSIRATLDGLSEESLKHLAETLGRVTRVLVYGVGASQVVAEDLGHKLLRLGFPVSAPEDFHVAAMTAGVFTPGMGLAILVSFSGDTKEVLELADLVRARGCAVMAITRFHTKNALAERAHDIFYVTAVEPEPRIGATTSVLASIVVGDALTLYLANLAPERTYRYLRDTEAAISGHRLLTKS